MRTVFEAEGEIRGTDLLAGLVTLWRDGASGALRFSRPGATASFHLSAGELVGVSASESRFESASILLRAGKLDGATLERLVTPEGGDRAVYALQAGILTKREWRWGEKIRAVEILSDLLTWIEGDYAFDPEEQTAAGEFRLTVPRLVLELFLRSRDRGLVLHYLGGVDVPLVRAPRFEAEFAVFGLTADAEAVVRLIDGKATAAEIASEGPADAFAVEKLLAALVTLGLVRPAFVPDEPVAIREAAPEERHEEEGIGEEEDAPEEEQPQTLVSEAAWQGRGIEEAEELEADPRLSEEIRAEVPQEPPSSEAELALDEEWGAPRTQPSSIDSQALRVETEAITDAPLHASQSSSEDLYREPEPDRVPRQDMMDLDQSSRDAEPAFEKPLDLATGIGGPARPRSRATGPLLWLLVILAVGVALVIVMRGHGSSSPAAAGVAVAETPTAVEVAAATEPVSTTVPSAVPTPPPVAAALAPTRVRPTAAPAAAPAARARPAMPAPAVAAVPSATAAVGGSRQSWLDRAARDQQRVQGDRKAHFTIQLELACEVASLTDAWKHDRPAGTMWVLATSFQGKTCFRVLWGRYATKDAARRAIAGVPSFFSTPRNHPAVTAIH